MTAQCDNKNYMSVERNVHNRLTVDDIISEPVAELIGNSAPYIMYQRGFLIMEICRKI